MPPAATQKWRLAAPYIVLALSILTAFTDVWN